MPEDIRGVHVWLDETDRRGRVVDLTQKGRTLIEQIFSEHAEHMEKLAEVLTPAERAQLIKTLRKLGKQASILRPIYQVTENHQPTETK